MLAPTPRQLEVLAYLRDNPSTVPPTRKEIGRRFGISPNAVERHLHALERKGLIRREAGKHRALSLTPAPAGRT